MAGTVASATHASRRSARQRRRAVSDALVRVCRADPVHLPADPDVRGEFVEAARHHRVAPLAQVRLRETDAELAEVLRADRDAAKTMYLRSAVLLDGFHQVLGDIPWVTFKGAVLSEHAHPVPGLRSFNDVDVAVSPRTLREVSTRLNAAGWQLFDRGDMLRNTELPGEMHWISPSGLLIDLHWSMINMTRSRRLFTVSTEQLLTDRVRVPLGLSSVWTLSPADTLVHVCLHAALTGAHRMLLLLDVDQLCRRTEDWDAVIAEAHRWDAALAVSLVLSRAHSVLGTPLPTNLDHRLRATSSFRAVTRTVDRIAPVPALRREASLARLVARSVRPGGLRTLIAIVRRGAGGLFGRLARDRDPVPWAEREPADATELETYLRAVERVSASST